MVDLAYLTTLHESFPTLKLSFQIMAFAYSDKICYVILQVRFVDEA
jgi:hypothetical protein